jgi:hypothetical protein
MGVEVFGKRGDVNVPIIIDRYAEAVVQIDSDHAYLHQGALFSAYHEATLSSSASYSYGFKTPATGTIHYRSAGIQSNKDSCRSQIWEDATYTAATGALVTWSNRNRLYNGSLPTGLELRAAPTFTVNGTQLVGFSSYLPGSTGVGQARIPSASSPALDEIVLKQNTTYRFVLINGSSDTAIIGVNFRFYYEGEG